MLKAGAFVRFTYRFHTGATADETKDDYKEVLVLHPGWQGRMHGIDLKRLTAAERAVLTLIFDPKSKGKKHGIPLVDDILLRMNPVEDVKNPVSFYQKFVKVFIRNKDVYRTYYPNWMKAVSVIRKSRVDGNVINPKPLFKTVNAKSPASSGTPFKPTKISPPPGRLELLKQRHELMKQRLAQKKKE